MFARLCGLLEGEYEHELAQFYMSVLGDLRRRCDKLSFFETEDGGSKVGGGGGGC
jgi:hypothetical protein